MKRIVIGLICICLLKLGFGCGGVQNFPKTSNDSHNNPATIAPASPAPFPSPSPNPDDSARPFEGFVDSAFSVTVDGVPYDDLEEFYTLTQKTLPERVKQVGYDSTWTPRLAAEIGLSDLWHDMIVYLAPTAGEGYQGLGRVDQSGHFAINVPLQGLDQVYRVRANKRISLVLTRGVESHRICYNFSAIEKAVPFHAKSLPVALDSFSTSITSYECSDLPNGGLDLKSLRRLPIASAWAKLANRLCSGCGG